MKSRGYLVMAPSVLRPLSAARVRPQGYDRRYDGCPARDAVRPAFAFHNSYRSFGDSVCGRDMGVVRADIVVIDATTPSRLSPRSLAVYKRGRQPGSATAHLQTRERLE